MSKTETKPAEKIVTHVAVTLRSADRPGIRAVGTYAPDTIHTVPVAEAARLVQHKGFAFVTPGDKAACESALAAITTTKSEG